MAAVLTAGTLTFADADARSISYDLNIPSEDLTASLQSFAIASHHKLLYKAELTAGKISRALKGHFTAQEAMEALLSGTGLSYEITGSSVVLIKDQTGAKTSELREEGTPYSPPAPSQSRGRHPILLAQVDQGKTASDVPVDKSDDQARKKKTKSLEEIVVTGSRLSEKAKDTAQPVNIYTRQAIDQTGVTSVADFLNTLPDASTASAGTVNTFAGGQSVQLHGLPSGTTLVLVNGRRIGASGTQAFGDVFDLNNIPLAAVDRIEVVPTGSSAVYGSDAIAGVVNIILKKDIEGVAVDARYGGAIGTRDSAISASAGHRWDAFDASVILSFDRKDELLGSDRAITKSSNYTPFGGPDN
ncbi:MAG TPA: TonB-dependent receptor plug domain-containing protein, partial [Steroidobacteraceae bacterium]|nr:TonB-dependent receptor plug domain-containing protein [Steroidobacteraceae bacterium]